MPTQSCSHQHRINSIIPSTASGDTNLSKDLQQEASRLSSQPFILYKSIREIWSTSLSSTAQPDLAQLLDGSVLVFNSPQPRKKSEELKKRLWKLVDMEERKDYIELVKDITPKKDPKPFSTYNDQLGFDLTAVGLQSRYLYSTIIMPAALLKTVKVLVDKKEISGAEIDYILDNYPPQSIPFLQ